MSGEEVKYPKKSEVTLPGGLTLVGRRAEGVNAPKGKYLHEFGEFTITPKTEGKGFDASGFTMWPITAMPESLTIAQGKKIIRLNLQHQQNVPLPRQNGVFAGTYSASEGKNFYSIEVSRTKTATTFSTLNIEKKKKK